METSNQNISYADNKIKINFRYLTSWTLKIYLSNIHNRVLAFKYLKAYGLPENEWNFLYNPAEKKSKSNQDTFFFNTSTVSLTRLK